KVLQCLGQRCLPECARDRRRMRCRPRQRLPGLGTDDAVYVDLRIALERTHRGRGRRSIHTVLYAGLVAELDQPLLHLDDVAPEHHRAGDMKVRCHGYPPPGCWLLIVPGVWRMSSLRRKIRRTGGQRDLPTEVGSSSRAGRAASWAAIAAPATRS